MQLQKFLPQKRRLKFLVSILERSPYALSCSFFLIRVHLFLSAPSSYAVQPCAHRSLRLGSYSARSSALQRVSVETNLPCEGPADLNQRTFTQHVTRCIYLSTYFSDVEMEFLVCTCHVRLICLFMYIPNSFVGVSHHPLGPKNMISVQYYLELVSTKNTQYH